MFFTDLAAAPEPGPRELLQFVKGVREFFGFVLQDEEGQFSFLWGLPDGRDLKELAVTTYRSDISDGAGLALDEAIRAGLDERQVIYHGLSGRPLHFKFAALGSLSDLWGSLPGWLSVRDWFRKVVEAIDAVLDSLIDAAGGAGGIIKEFKDTLLALA